MRRYVHFTFLWVCVCVCVRSLARSFVDFQDVSVPKRAPQMSGVCIGADIYLDVY